MDTLRDERKSQAARGEIVRFLDVYGELHGDPMVPESQVPLYVVTRAQGIVIGCVKIKPVNWYQADLSHLAVHPEFRREGVATRLVETACQRAAQAKCRIVRATVRRDNQPARGLFRNLGFVPTLGFTGLSGKPLDAWDRVLQITS